MKLEFHGAVGGVTGSHMVINDGSTRIGIDAGLFQGGDADRNRLPFGHDPRSLRVLMLTHAHLDHSGRIPLLVKEGFRGPIYSTPATVDLCGIMLKDSAYLMEEEASHENPPPQETGSTTSPLYRIEDVTKALKQFRRSGYGRKLETSDFTAVFKDAGHILGSAIIELLWRGKTLVFSGDLGRPGAPFLHDRESIKSADYLILESTYGDRDHSEGYSRGRKLQEVVVETQEKGGNVVIPSFAVGRTQEVLYELNSPAEGGKLKDIKCYVDSPMAIRAVKAYHKNQECFNSETRRLMMLGFDPLSFPSVNYTSSKEESRSISLQKEPHIIISASGMCTGGRVLHHLAENLERPECTVTFVGFQAEGTLGRKIQRGDSSVTIDSKHLDVRARIESIPGFSAHSDRGELLQWLKGFDDLPGQIFLCHGEPNAAESIAMTIKDEFGANVTIPNAGASYQLG
jgi:metallo-beta-lactamase family protein